MNTFLVPINSIHENKSTLIYAIDFAKETGVKHIYGIQLEEIKEEDHLKDIVDYAESKNVEINFRHLEGDIIEYIKSFHSRINIDLVISAAKVPEINESVYLDQLSGNIIRETHLNVLLVPEGYTYKNIETVLTAVKSGIMQAKGVLNPLEHILVTLNAHMTLLQVKTPEFLPEDLMFDKDLAALTSKYYSSENATLFQGVLEYLHIVEPDLLCVFRRKRGFFEKLWSKTIHDNRILKEDFQSKVPLLVLKEEQ